MITAALIIAFSVMLTGTAALVVFAVAVRVSYLNLRRAIVDAARELRAERKP